MHCHAVHAALQIEVIVVDRFLLAAVVATAPDAGAIEFEIDALLECRTTIAFVVDRFNIDEHHVGTIGL